MSETASGTSTRRLEPADVVLVLIGIGSGFYGFWFGTYSIFTFAALLPPLFLAGLVWTFPRLGPMRRRQLALWSGLVPAFILTMLFYPRPHVY